jgi:DNA-binding CsgD family transcriptional regulator
VASSRRTVPSQVASAQRKLGAANREHAWQLMADEAG